MALKFQSSIDPGLLQKLKNEDSISENFKKIRNYFSMVEFNAERWSLLARLAMATSGKPSTKFPLGELEGQEPLQLSFSHISLKFVKFPK